MSTRTRAALVLGLTILCVNTLTLAGPLQPSAKQVRSVLKTVLADSRCPDKAVVVSAGPAELAKNWEEDPTDVMVEVVIRDPVARRLYEITANATTNKVTEWQRVDDQEPIIHPNDIDSVYKIVTNHKPWLASLERRGLSVDDVFLDAWPSGIPRNAFRFRNVRVVTYLKQSGSKPRFAQPVEGLVATINLDARRVFEFFDRDIAPIPESTIDLSKEYRNTKRKRLAPFKVQQNTRDAIKISNGVVDWNGWMFIPLVHAKDGLVLHNVSHTVNKTTRTIAARLSVSEIISTTTSTSQYWFFRQPMYVGEYGLGANIVEQRVGVDLPANIRTIEGARLVSNSKIDDIPSAIALYEIDADPVWTFTSDGPQGRKGRSLVVQTRSFVAQRDVIQRYVISVDGSITIDVGVGGSPMIEAVKDSVYYEDSEGELVNGVLVAPHAKVPYQSLLASFRLDLDLDGVENTVSEVDLTEPQAGTDPYQQSVLRDEYPLYFEQEAARDVDVQAHRHWKVLAQSKNELGGRRAYRVTVGPQDLLLADRHPLFSRAAFVQHALWVTAFNENELYATGAYPNQQVITNGVNTYQYNNDRIKDSDVVLWVTQSTSYLPRIEDHPSGRMQHVSVRIEPDGFFDANPTIDLPPQR